MPSDDLLLELAVTNLGVIEQVSIVLEGGMTALTGETGAGKTLIVTAIELLAGAKADVGRIGPADDEAVVEGRFWHDGVETVVQRVLSRSGRSRAYVDGRLATVASLAELGAGLVELHGQHAQQELLRPVAQRAALDRYGGVDLDPLGRARAELRRIDDELAGLGGDERDRLRELDLLRFEAAELEAAGLDDPDEDEALRAVEDLLADAGAHRAAAAGAVELLDADGPAADGLAGALALLAGRAPFHSTAERISGLAAELVDVRAELRDLFEAIEDDPVRLASVQERRRLLADLRRKYGDTLAEVIDHAHTVARRIAELEGHAERTAVLEAERRAAEATVAERAAEVGRARRAGAGPLAAAVVARLRTLAMPAASLEVRVGADPGDDVEILLAANPGSVPAPLQRVASGGELSRVMLALRLVLSASPPTLIFDEVDAGIGGETALAVGRSLRELAADRQVLVVTHLPQVAAFADHQVRVAKRGGRSGAAVVAEVLDHDERVVELSRMLSGSPGSGTAREHAAELLREAQRPGAVRAGRSPHGVG